jgi:hypothetical protein
MRPSLFVTVLATMLVVAGPASAAEDEPSIIPWNEAEKHVGETLTVEGYVLGKHCSPTSCLLAFDPSFNQFTAVIQAKDFKTFSPDTLDAKFVGRKVRVKGKIQMLEKKPEIIVSSPDDLQVVVTAREKAEQRAASQDEVVDRMADILERLETLIARVEATQARLEDVANALADQSEQLAELQAAANAPPPPEPEPSYGEPQPRPAYEALRTIKRGMTSEQVERLVGSPLMSESNANGSFVWYYGYGRSVTFDRRNRAVALVGFPTS